MTPDRRMLLALFSLAFGLRLLYAAVIGVEFHPPTPTHDYEVARQIASGEGWISKPFSPRAPGYQLLLASVFTVAGVRLWAVILMQAAIGGFTVLVVYRLGEKCLSRNVGLFSALWLSLYVHQLQFTCLLLRDILTTFFFLLLVYSMARYYRKMRGSVWTGLVYVLLIHINPQFLTFLPFLALFFLFYATRHKLLNAQYVFIFLATVFLLSTPWTIRNYLVYQDFVPISLEAPRYARPLTSLGQPKDEIEERPRMKKRPGFARNVAEMWRVVKFGEHDSQSPTDTGDGSVKGTTGWSLPHNLTSLVNYGLLIPFLLVGMVTAFRKKNLTGMTLTGALVGYSLVRAFYGGSERARLPAEPMLTLLAFYGLMWLVSLYRTRKSAPTAGNSA